MGILEKCVRPVARGLGCGVVISPADCHAMLQDRGDRGGDGQNTEE